MTKSKTARRELSMFVDQAHDLPSWRDTYTIRMAGGTSRFNMDENNQKTTSRVASASANKLYHRILDTSIPCAHVPNSRV